MGELRADYVNMQAAGLSLIGRALGSAAEKTPSATAVIANRVARVDWRRDAELWQGTWRRSVGSITRSKRDMVEGWKLLQEVLKID
jgi:hypothetical protein